jgi:hypothetical protein
VSARLHDATRAKIALPNGLARRKDAKSSHCHDAVCTVLDA